METDSTAAAAAPPPAPAKTYSYVVEHLDPELGEWSRLEYRCIAEESRAAGACCLLTSVSTALEVPADLKALPGLQLHHESVEDLFSRGGSSGSSGSSSSSSKDRVCLLDPGAAEELTPKDALAFDVFLFGGILGDDPPRDRTSELRDKGFVGRRLGPKQMTTDTAVRVTRTIVQGQTPFEQIPFVDSPELRLDEHETTTMPFRYVRGPDGRPVMPEGMLELIQKDADKSIEDLF